MLVETFLKARRRRDRPRDCVRTSEARSQPRQFVCRDLGVPGIAERALVARQERLQLATCSSLDVKTDIGS